MSAPIGVGDFVECLRTSPSGAVVKGRIYQVIAMPPVRFDLVCGVCRNGDDDADRTLHLGRAPNDDAGWCPCRFKPVYRPRRSLIDSLKAPPKEAPSSNPRRSVAARALGPASPHGWSRERPEN